MRSKKRVLGASSLSSYVIAYTYLRNTGHHQPPGTYKWSPKSQTTKLWVVLSALPALVVVVTAAGLVGFRVCTLWVLVFVLPYAWAVGTYVEGVAARNCESVAKARQALPRARRIRIDVTVILFLLAYATAMIALLAFSREIYLGRL